MDDRLSVAMLALVAVIGEFCAITALYAGVGRIATQLTLAGVWSALLLVMAPMILRALASLLSDYPWQHAVILHYVVPWALVISAIVLMLT